MKLTEIINESNTDQVAKYYRTGTSYEPDNASANEYVEQNKDRYRKLFRDFYKKGEIIVFDKDDHQPKQPKLTNKPEEGVRKSAGYRGNQVAKRRSGLPYDKDVFN